MEVDPVIQRVKKWLEGFLVLSKLFLVALERLTGWSNPDPEPVVFPDLRWKETCGALSRIQTTAEPEITGATGATIAAPQTFTCFLNLPPELRLIIWGFAAAQSPLPLHEWH
ncbi:hypothetical protein B0T16DRAFT_458927 [Cercophora newfieldiana]|uniref:Uncharacterized protein n=1 Tax=Cercophora newfieldiana TaxID=92897 RepID=A0AA40CRR8_9PEZI|nr:hypothetical protein B0T16DRAFT_458927 [Cercophora newfieldiana]